MTVSKLFRDLVILAFLSFLSFCQDNSAFADKHHLGYTFIIAGVILALMAAYVVYELVTFNDRK